MTGKNDHLRTLSVIMDDSHDAGTNTTKETIGITLVADGILISGEMISQQEFLSKEQNLYLTSAVNAYEQTEMRRRQKAQADYSNFDNNSFLHLKNAFYFMTESKTIPTHNGTYIRVGIDSVSAYNMGTLRAESN